jgi:hypothetical protein
MKHTVLILALLPAFAVAGSFDGTWVTKPETIKITGKPDKFLLADGMFTCGPCTPSYTVKADGSVQKLQGHPYYDGVSVKVVDEHTVEVKAYAGAKLFSERKFLVSADGQKLNEEMVNYDGPKPEKATFASTRVEAGPAGAAALSGTWKPDQANTTLPPEYLTVTYIETAGGLKMSSPTGQSYDAKFDGKAVPIVGDTGKTMASIKRIDAQTIEETDTRDGKITDVSTGKVSSDGKTMYVIDKDHLHGTTTTLTAVKQ